MIRLAALATVLVAGVAIADPSSEAAQGYAVEPVVSPSAVKVGGHGTVGVVIKPKAPAWHVHPQAPLKIHFVAPAGLKLERSDMGRKDATDPGAESPRFESPFLATAAGKQQVVANVDFFICSDVACVKQVKSVTIPVDVK